MKGEDNKSQSLIEEAKRIGIDVQTMEVRGRLDAVAIMRLHRMLKKLKVDVVHSHDFKSDFYTVFATAGLGIRKVSTAHGSTRDSLLKKVYLTFTEVLVYRFFDRVIAVSEDMRDQLRRKGLRSSKVKVIQNGIDFNLLDGGGRTVDSGLSVPAAAAGKTSFVVVGRLFPDKGHRFLISAFQRVLKRNPSIICLIVGDGPYREEIERQIKRLHLESSVLLCGVQSNMKQVYKTADFLVIPSLREGLPYTLLEAMGFRVPVLATSVGDIPHLIQDRATGHLIRPGNVGELEERMLEMLENPESARRMADRAYTVVTNRFSAKRMVEKTCSLYQTLTGFSGSKKQGKLQYERMQ
jgi:glycosyltransferase involved in cell wall biosynthesis